MTNPNKKYFLLKLKNDFFKQREMKKLRKLAGGAVLTIIYLKMQLLSLTEEAKIYYAETENSIYEQIAIELDEEEEDIKLMVMFLKQNNLIEIDKEDTLFLVETKELIGSETDTAVRMRKSRNEKKNRELKTIENNQNLSQCYTSVTNCYTEIEIEKDLEKDLEKEKILKAKKNITKVILKKEFEKNEIIEQFFLDELAKELFYNFLELRKKLKAINSEQAIKLLLNKLQHHNLKNQIKMIEQSIENSYKSIYELKQNFNKQSETYEERIEREKKEFGIL